MQSEQNVNTPIDVKDLMNATSELNKLLEHEADLLASMKLTQVGELSNVRDALLSKLEHYKVALSENPDAMKQFSRGYIDKFRDQAVKLERNVATDMEQLQRARGVHRIMMKAITNTLTKKLSLAGGYNKSGVHDDGKKAQEYLPPVNFNAEI